MYKVHICDGGSQLPPLGRAEVEWTHTFDSVVAVCECGWDQGALQTKTFQSIHVYSSEKKNELNKHHTREVTNIFRKEDLTDQNERDKVLTGLQFRGARLTAMAGNVEGWGLAACTQPTLSAAEPLYMSMAGPGELAAGKPLRAFAAAAAACGDAGGPKPWAAAAAAWQLFITAKETEKCGCEADWSAPD